MKESALQTKCIKYCKDLAHQGANIMVINQHGGPYAQRGVSDLLLNVEGRFVAIELKVGTNTPTPLQMNFLKKVYESKGLGFICYDLAEFKSIIKKCFPSDNPNDPYPTLFARLASKENLKHYGVFAEEELHE